MPRSDEPENQTHTFLRSLGQGLLGPVWQARRASDGQIVRYKELRRHRPDSEPLLSGLRQLGERLQSIKSPSVCRILGCGRLSGGGVYIETPFIDGQPLPEWLAGATSAQALEVLRQVAALLAQVHALGLTHGALRPSQLIVTRGGDGQPLCLLQDIGLAAQIQPPLKPAELTAEARAFVAPELASAGALAAAEPTADVYALGQLLLWVQARLSDAATAGLRSRSTPLSALAQKLLDPQPARRPTMADAASELRRLGDRASDPKLDPTAPHLREEDIPASTARRAVGTAANAKRPPSRLGDFLPADRVGQKLDDYLLTKVLGQGGMGAVFEAVHQQIGRRVAIKVLWPELATDRSVRERFRGEAQAANRVEHRNIVEITDFREASDGTLYLVMELLAGQGLRKRLEGSPGGLGARPALHIAQQCALALAAAHQQGVIHRDFKPENVMLTREAAEDSESASGLPSVKVLDFGIAKILFDPDKQDLTNPALSAFLGTLEYAAPEQFGDPRGGEGDPATRGEIGPPADVFSLGVVLCELWSGRRPFAGFSMLLFADDPPPPSLPSGMSARLRALLERMLLRTPTERPAMAEVLSVLRQELQDLTPAAQLGPPPTASWRRLLLPTLLSLLVVVLLANVALQYWPRGDAVDRARLYVPDAMALLRAGLQDSALAVRRAAILSSGVSGRSDLIELLVPMMKDADRPTLGLVARALQRQPVAGAQEALRLAIQQRPFDSHGVEAAAALARLQEPVPDAGKGALLAMLRDGSGPTKARAALRLCERHDPAGCEGLWGLLRGVGKDVDRWEALFTLAAAEDAAAEAQLTQALESAGSRQLRMLISGYLARLRSPKSAIAERTLAEAAKAGDFDAALLAAQARNPAGHEVLLAVLADPARALALRISAAEALGEAGDLSSSLAGLGTVLRDPKQPIELRLATAAALLRLAGPSVGKDGDPSLTSLCALYPRLLACLLAESNAAPSEENLGTAFANLGHPERKLMARLLSGKHNAAAAAILLRALEDPDYVVRSEALQSLKRVLGTLRGAGRSGVDANLMALIGRLLSSKNPYDQVIALSLQESDAASRARLLALLRDGAQPKALRGLIVELAERRDDNPLLIAGLLDRDREVRFAAARHLAELGSARGADVLREVVAVGEGWSILAYALLHRLGLAPSSGAGVDWERILRGEAQLWARFEAVASLPMLPPERAIPLLWVVMNDPAAVVRHQAAETAASLLRQHPSARQRSLLVAVLRGLSTDSELYVRARAMALLAALDPRAASPAPPPALAPAAPALPSPPSPPPAVARGAAPVAVDSPPDQGTPEPAASPARPPVAAVEAGRKATAPNPLALKATQAFEQAQRDAGPQPIQAMRALSDLRKNAYLTDKQRDRLNELMQQLRQELTSYRVKRVVNNGCVLDKEINWQKPSRHTIQPAGIKYKITQTLEAGKDYVCDFCVSPERQECR